MIPDTVAVHWHKAGESPNPVAISVLWRFLNQEDGQYVYGVLDMVDGAVLLPTVEWLPLGLFDHSLYVDDNPEAVALLPR